jgi:hypothetical protein
MRSIGRRSGKSSHIEDSSLLLDVLKLVELALAAAGARFAGLGPSFGRLQIGIPERPGAALAGPLFVHRTFTALVIEEYAVAIFVFVEAAADPDLPDILFLEFRRIHFEPFGEGVDFRLVDPHVSWRAGAAISAARAFEFQTVLIPRFSGIRGW